MSDSKTFPGQSKPQISGGRDLNKPAVPEYIKAGKTMRRIHDGGAKKAPHK